MDMDPRKWQGDEKRSCTACIAAAQSVMRVIVLHPYTMFEVRSPFRSEDMVYFRSRR